jgi:hypothetical protein
MSQLSVILEEFAAKAKELEALLQSHIAEITDIVGALSPIIEVLVPGSAGIIGTVNEVVNAVSTLAPATASVSQSSSSNAPVATS